MRKNDLAYCLHKDIDNWEIVNIGYDNISKRIDLLLRNFEWKSVPFGRDYKEFNENLKKLNLMDEYAFVYYEDGKLVNSVEEYVRENKGLNLNQIKELVKTPEVIHTTTIQTDWINILQSLGCFDVVDYKNKFLLEYKKFFLKYMKENTKEDCLEIIKFFEELNLDLKDNNL